MFDNGGVRGSEFLRKVTLDTDGTVMFPGSPELWMVIKGRAGSVGNTSKLLKKIHKKVAPDVSRVCKWIVAQRAKTSKPFPDGSKPVEFGQPLFKIRPS